jgi:flagellar basal body-associated protein FliL
MNKRKIIYISSAVVIAAVAGITYFTIASNNDNVERQAPAPVPAVQSPANTEPSTDRTDQLIVHILIYKLPLTLTIQIGALLSLSQFSIRF